MIVYDVLDCLEVREVSLGRFFFWIDQFIILSFPCPALALKLASLSFKSPDLHLLIGHELKCAITDAKERQRRATVETFDTLLSVHGGESIFGRSISRDTEMIDK
jgi:hypothetical protein